MAKKKKGILGTLAGALFGSDSKKNSSSRSRRSSSSKAKTSRGKSTGKSSSSKRTSSSKKRPSKSVKKTPSKPSTGKTKDQTATNQKPKAEFPKRFPFWARLKICKNRTTLVIDEAEAYNKQRDRMEPGFVHREAIHPNETGSNVKGYEEIKPNPDKTDAKPMYLKGPEKLPKVLFKPHNKDLDMPKHLKERYEKNNKE